MAKDIRINCITISIRELVTLMATKPMVKNSARRARIWITSILGLAAAIAPAQSAEQKIKATYLYNFAKYVEWPTTSFDSSNRFVIGIVGRDSRIRDAVCGDRSQ